MGKLKIGISGCLLGQKVRFDGGHKQLKLATQDFSPVFEYVSFCPEMGIGLGTPRKTIRLIGDPKNPRAVQSDDLSVDHTEQLKSYFQQQLSKFAELSGFIVCKDSPSCGYDRVKVYESSSKVTRTGVGIFTREIMKKYPLLPIEDSGRLNDVGIRDSFLKRVFIFDEWKKSAPTLAGLQQFHARHKYLLLSHSQKQSKQLGQLVAQTQRENLKENREHYIEGVMNVLNLMASRKNTTNTLMHIQGYFKTHLDASERQELSNVISEYRNGEQPFLSPMTLIKHYLKKYPNDYLSKQSFFVPYQRHLNVQVSL